MSDEDRAEEAAHEPTPEDLAAEKQRVEQQEAEEKQQREHERRARFANHPHTRLRAILKDLQAPAAISSDVATKHAHLHAAVSKIVQMMVEHTPAPEEEHDDGQEQRREQQPAQGHEQPVS